MSVNSYKKFKLEGPLTDEQVEFFDRNGFIHFENFMDVEGIDRINSSLAEVQEQWIANEVKDVNGIPVKYGIDMDGKKMVHRFPFSNLYSAPVKDLLRDERLMFIKSLSPGCRINEEEKDGVAVNHYVNVPGSTFKHLGWHTDNASDLFYGKKIMPHVIAGLCLDDSSAENGGLRVIPGTHKQNAFSMLFRKLYFLNTDDDKDEVLVEAKKGDLVIHDGRTWHRAGQSPHIGERSRRRALFIAFIVGAYEPKNAKSSTPFYFKFQNLIGS